MKQSAKIPNVAIVGRPNVGKSALFNRLTGRKIAIVHGQPGITRDRLSATCTRGARPFTVWDTAGIFGAGENELTAPVRRGADLAARESDVVLFVVDGRHGLSPMDKEAARALHRLNKPVILVVNKIDTEKHEPLIGDFDSLGFQHAIPVSAEHNRGTLELLDAVNSLLPVTASGIENQELQDSLRIAVVGRPNVGKSSLVNAITQSERAIVSELPGTTRDAIDILFERDHASFMFIDTAGMRRRGKHSSSVEVFSVMRAEKTVRRADLCVLVIDAVSGVTAQDRRIAGLIQEAGKSSLIVLNKWDLVKPRRGEKEAIRKFVATTYENLFFADYAPVLVGSARTGENIESVFGLISKIESSAQARIGTGPLNRLLRAAFASNPPPMRQGKRLKLFYAAQAAGNEKTRLRPPEFVLFVNDPALMTEQYRRFLEARIRKKEPYTGLPIFLTLRPRQQN